MIKWKYIMAFALFVIITAYFFNTGIFLSHWEKLFKNNWLESLSYFPAGIIPISFGYLFIKLNKSFVSTISFLGNNFKVNSLIALAPLIAFTIIGINNKYNIQSNVYAFLFSSINLVYAIGEEYGWRKYLQDELRFLKPIIRYLIVGLIWWIWHWRFGSIFEWTLFPLIVIASAFILGKLAEDTKSYFVAAGMHSFIIIISNTVQFDWRIITACVLTISIWITINRYQKYKLNKLN